MLIITATGKLFTYNDICASYGGSAGYDKPAPMAAETAVAKFPAGVFHLNLAEPRA